MPALVWLITGCSSGFGEQFTRNILARGDKVIATARDPSRIQHLANIGASILQLDITDSKESINATVKQAAAEHGRIDVLVNNAAYVAIGLVEDLTHDDYLAQFNTNVFGTIKITQAVLPYMRAQRSGTIIFISSLSGWIGHPGVSAYASSKFAIEGIAEALRDEVKDFGIKTLLIEPGRFRTKLLSETNLKPTNTSEIGDYRAFSKTILTSVAGESGRQPGYPAKLVDVVIDVVKGEGVAAGKQAPFRLPLGGDCYEEMEAKLDATQNILARWKEVILSTDLDDQE